MDAQAGIDGDGDGLQMRVPTGKSDTSRRNPARDRGKSAPRRAEEDPDGRTS